MYEIKYRDKEEMKDSGIEWLGKIPDDWQIVKCKYLCEIKTGDKDTQDRVDDGKYPFFVRSKNVERINSYSYEGEAILTPGDGDIGEIFHYINGKFNYHQRVYKFSNFKRINSKYLYYYLSEYFKRKVIGLSAKSTVDSLRLPMLLNFECLNSNKNEQEKISNFLDHKTSQFDSIIEKKEKLIEKLEEAKKSLISEVVTGKVKIVDGELVKRDESEMKDSGVEWLGKIPKDWSLKKIKFTSLKIKNGIWGNDEKKNSNDIYCIRVTNFNRVANDVDTEDLTIRNLDKIKQKEYLLNKNDLLIEKSGGGENQLVGFVVIYNKDIPAIYANFMARIIIKKEYDNKYLLYYFRHMYNLKVNYKHIKQTTGIQNLDTSSYFDEKIGLPSLSKQLEISRFLDKKLIHFDNITKTNKKQIEKLKQAKQSLISEAVTGKIDLRGWEIKSDFNE